MNRHTSDMLHDEAMHEGIRRLVFLVGLAALIVALHRIFYATGF